MLMGLRDQLVTSRTQLSNAIRGYATEFGVTAAKGKAHLEPLLERIQADESLPVLARELFAVQAEGYRRSTGANRRSRCQAGSLAKVRRVQPAARQDPRRRPDWRGASEDEDSGARTVQIGATVRRLDRSDAQRTIRPPARPGSGVITRAGDETLRSVLVVGATAVIQHAQRSGKASPWLAALLKRKPPKLVAVALAQQDGPHRLEADGHGPKLRHDSLRPPALAERSLEISQARPQFNDQPCRADARTCKQTADDVIDRSPARDTPLSVMAIVGRSFVRNSCRGNHLGQRSCASATTGPDI